MRACVRACVCLCICDKFLVDNLHLVNFYKFYIPAVEFRSSLRSLSASHPTAYRDFVKLMQPTECNISHVRVTADEPLPMATMNSSLNDHQRVPDTRLSRGEGYSGVLI